MEQKGESEEWTEEEKKMFAKNMRFLIPLILEKMDDDGVIAFAGAVDWGVIVDFKAGNELNMTVPIMEN